MHTEDQITAIKEIHGLLADSRKEFESESKRVRDQRARELLHAISMNRAALEAELEMDLHRSGTRSKLGDGTVGGTIHRVLLEARDTLNSTTEVNVLVECERQESDLLGRYNKVLGSADLDKTTRAMLVGQHARIQENVERVNQLRRQLESVEH